MLLNYFFGRFLFVVLVMFSCYYSTLPADLVMNIQQVNIEDAIAFIGTVPSVVTGFFDPSGFTHDSDFFPDYIKPTGILWEGTLLSGVRTEDNLYFAVQLVEFDFAIYESFIIPFENDFASSGIFVIPEDSDLTYQYAYYSLIDPATNNFCYYHSISVVLSNNLESISDLGIQQPGAVKALYFFKHSF